MWRRDPSTRRIDGLDQVQEVGDCRLLGDAAPAEIFLRQLLEWAVGLARADPLGGELGEDVGALPESLAVHDRVGDRLAQCDRRILQGALPTQALERGSGAWFVLDELPDVRDIGRDVAVETLATLNDVHLDQPSRVSEPHMHSGADASHA